MARQQRIPGTGRPGIPEALEEACADLLETRRDGRRIKREQTDKIKTAEWKVLTLMQEHDHPKLSIKDDETDELLNFDLEQVLRITKSGEVASEDGEDDDAPSVDPSLPPGVTPGLIAQAEKAQADAGIVETAEGDVVPSDAPAPKAKRGRKPKNGAN